MEVFPRLSLVVLCRAFECGTPGSDTFTFIRIASSLYEGSV